MTDTAAMDLLEDGATTIADATAWSGLSRVMLKRAMDAGELAYSLVGHRRMIPRRALRDYLARHVVRVP